MRRHNLAGELSCPDNQTDCRISSGPIKEIGVLEKEATYQERKHGRRVRPILTELEYFKGDDIDQEC